MSETRAKPAPASGRDYSETLFLPRTDFPMRAGLPQREPILLERWARTGLYRRLREAAAGRKRFILHDGPPYANGNIHIGHALNKILKDLVTRSQGMLGHDSNYVPGWDCHGLPIEWKIEEQYRAAGRNKDEVPTVEFRRECRAFAEHWLDVQRTEFKRLGVEGDWDHPYTTMAFPAEAQISREIMDFARTGQLYRGSKPVMWSPVERTALAEAEVEYHEHTSPTVWVAFPVIDTVSAPLDADLVGSSVVIWTTTPWTIPANRGITYGPDIPYGLYRVTEAPAGNWAEAGSRYVLADKLAADVMAAAKVSGFERVRDVLPYSLLRCAHPFRGLAGANGFWDYGVPVLPADYVTDDTGTGFVHSAPGHGLDDYGTFLGHRDTYASAGTAEVPHTIDEDSAYLPTVPIFAGLRVLDPNGREGGANAAVTAKLAEVGALVARGRLKHQYPHSWRSKAPLIFRNTPQWFIAMDRPLSGATLPPPNGAEPGANGVPDTLRNRALDQIHNHVRWVPQAGENRIHGMIANRPDWVVSRQRAWGVPIAIFVRRGTDEILLDERVDAAIADAFDREGADSWFEDGAAARFLSAGGHDPADYDKVDDILDVWFDSGSTHAFTLESPEHFPGLAGTRRKVAGGQDTVMYLEGSDQHRGWFHSSLLESCGTRGRAPFDVVLTHGFVLDEAGNKMSKSSRNGVSPQDAIKGSGADILRLWAAGTDTAGDVTLSTDIMKGFADLYRKLRNTIRWMLGTLAHHDGTPLPRLDELPELERYMLHRLAELDCEIRDAYGAFDYSRVVTALSTLMTVDLSAFYFDIRKDVLYCDPILSDRRHAALATVDVLFRSVTTWIAPILCFTAEEAWLDRFPSETGSVHLETFPAIPGDWQDEALDGRWRVIRRVRRVVTAALEERRALKDIGSSLEAAPIVYIPDQEWCDIVRSVPFADVCITSGCEVRNEEAPDGAFCLPQQALMSAEDREAYPDRQAAVRDALKLQKVGVEYRPAAGRKCARSWKFSPEVGENPVYPDVTARDAEALRQWDDAHGRR